LFSGNNGHFNVLVNEPPQHLIPGRSPRR